MFAEENSANTPTSSRLKQFLQICADSVGAALARDWVYRFSRASPAPTGHAQSHAIASGPNARHCQRVGELTIANGIITQQPFGFEAQLFIENHCRLIV